MRRGVSESKGEGLRPGQTSIESNPLAVRQLREVEESLRTAYRGIHNQYRRDDELEVTTENHRHLGGLLGKISASFGRPISVLDVGCGTGRYFHCLKNVKRLVGVDLSPEMLQGAENPVLQKEVSAGNIELICGNAHLLSFPARSFDLIYSLGMFGHGCPVTVQICNQFYEWLAGRGKLLFNAVDMSTLSVANRWRTKLRRLVYAALPARFQEVLDKREGNLPFYGLTKKGLKAILRASQFREFTISPQVCRSPLWHGVHLECMASKGD